MRKELGGGGGRDAKTKPEVGILALTNTFKVNCLNQQRLIKGYSDNSKRGLEAQRSHAYVHKNPVHIHDRVKGQSRART